MTNQNNSINAPTTANTVVTGNGTGYTNVSYSATSGTSNIMSRDSSGNTYANSLISGYATTATAASTTTLTVASPQQQYFTGSTTQTVVMPVVSTLVLGQTFLIINNSTGVVTVQSSGTNTIQAMGANSVLQLTVISTSGTSAASWNAEYSASGSALTTIDMDSGSISGSTVTIATGNSTQNSGATFLFTGSGTTGTLNVTDSNSNTQLGYQSGNSSTTSGTLGNAAFGYRSLKLNTSGNHNTAFGTSSLQDLISGSGNLALGNGAGVNYTSSESYNISLNTNATGGESHTLRIGNGTGSTTYQLNQAFISGINGVTSSNPVVVTINSSTDQLGVIGSSDNGVLISGTGGAPSWLANGTAGYVLTAQSSNPPAWAAAPFVGLTWAGIATNTNAVVNNSYFATAALTLTLPASPSIGQTVKVIAHTSGSVVVAANTGQTISIGTSVSSSGGSATNSASGDALNLVAYSSTAWFSEGAPQGVWTTA